MNRLPPQVHKEWASPDGTKASIEGSRSLQYADVWFWKVDVVLSRNDRFQASASLFTTDRHKAMRLVRKAFHVSV